MISLDRKDAVWVLTMPGGENRFHRESLREFRRAMYGEVTDGCGAGTSARAGE